MATAAEDITKSFTLEDKRVDPSESFRLAVPQLNIIMPGGVPRKHILEIYGEKGVGKTTLALSAVRAAQEMSDVNVLWVDTEGKLDPELAEINGVDPSRMIYYHPPTIEHAVTAILNALRGERDNTGRVIGDYGIKLIVLDSLGGGTSATAANSEIGKKNVANRAAIWTILAEQVMVELAKANASLILVNQIRDNINDGGAGFKSFGPKTHKTGGRAIGFAVSTVLKLQNLGQYVSGPFKGKRIKCTVEFNCVGLFGRQIEYPIVTDPEPLGIDIPLQLVTLCESAKLVIKSGSWLYAPFLSPNYDSSSPNDPNYDYKTDIACPKGQGVGGLREYFTDADVQAHVLNLLAGGSIVPSGPSSLVSSASDEDDDEAGEDDDMTSAEASIAEFAESEF